MYSPLRLFGLGPFTGVEVRTKPFLSVFAFSVRPSVTTLLAFTQFRGNSDVRGRQASDDSSHLVFFFFFFVYVPISILRREKRGIMDPTKFLGGTSFFSWPAKNLLEMVHFASSRPLLVTIDLTVKRYWTFFYSSFGQFFFEFVLRGFRTIVRWPVLPRVCG